MSDSVAASSLEARFNKLNLVELWKNFSMMNTIVNTMDSHGEMIRAFIEDDGGLEMRYLKNPDRIELICTNPDGSEDVLTQQEFFDYIKEFRQGLGLDKSYADLAKEQLVVARGVIKEAGPVSLCIGVAAIAAFIASPPNALATLTAARMARVANNCVKFAALKAKFDKLDGEQRRSIVASFTTKEMLLETATKWTFLELVKAASVGIVGEVSDEISVLNQVNVSIDNALRSSESGVLADFDPDVTERKAPSSRRMTGHALEV